MIKTGTSGFSFKDWMGTVYPENLRKEDMLTFYQEELGFDTVELNFTYYTIPSEKAIEGLEKKTSSNFEFAVKVFKGITHDPFDRRISEKPSISKIKAYCECLSNSLYPLRNTGKLGVVLMQFPVFFRPSKKNLDYLLMTREYFREDTLAIEFRNSEWVKDDTFSFLKKNALAFCSVDEPKLPRLMPFVEITTSDTAYIRLHGRNNSWFNAPLSVRYDYLYSTDELQEFIPQIKKINSNAERTFIFFNNCHSGSAAINAKMLKDMIVTD